MSDMSQGPGWWQASDGRWYPPTATPGTGTPTHGPPPYGTPTYGPPAYGTAFGYGYGPPNPYGTATGLPSVAGLATASMVLGILSVVICCWPLMACSLAGLPLGIAALTRIQRGTADPRGKGQAITGVVLSSIAVVLGILFLVLTYVGRSS
jgi:hypothetical protein